MSDHDHEKGEGNRESARRYNDAAQKTARSGEVEKRKRERRESDDAALRDAEREGREKAGELDPEVKRDYRKPS